MVNDSVQRLAKRAAQYELHELKPIAGTAVITVERPTAISVVKAESIFATTGGAGTMSIYKSLGVYTKIR